MSFLGFLGSKVQRTWDWKRPDPLRAWLHGEFQPGLKFRSAHRAEILLRLHGSLQCRRILAGRVDIYFHRMFRLPSWNRKTVESWGEVKSLPRVGERKKNWGRGRGTFRHSRPNSPSLQWIQNSGKPLDRPPKPPALQANYMVNFSPGAKR